MSNSNLVNVNLPAYKGNYSIGRSGRKIEMITIHHMAGVLTAEECGKIFQKVGRNGSSNYGIGNDGRIGLYVDESNTSWANSNWDANCKAVTIEVSNSQIGGNWKVSDVALNSLIKLVANIAKRNNLGTLIKGKNVTWHRMYTDTECPGEYILSKMDYIISEANKINLVINSNSNSCNYLVKINTTELNVRDGAGVNYKINKVVYQNEVYTIVEEKNGWGKLKSGAGWICLDYTKKYNSINVSNNYYPIPKYNGNSIVEALNLINVDSSFNNRKLIAQKNNIRDYDGSAVQNKQILDKLKAGMLLR